MPEHRIVGTYRGVVIDVAAWDAVGAMVELSCAGMFTHEVDHAPLVGGLLDLDTALEGRLLTMRAAQAFRADRMETVMLRTLPPVIRAEAVLMIGLGSPEDWSAEVMEHATRVAVREANRVGAESAGIAPGMLDSGLTPDRTGDATSAMLRGVTGAIDAELRLVELGLALQPTMKSWTFGTGAAHLEDATSRFRAALRSVELPSS
jgi:hypothetical protein